jgi:hypothetical protein
MIPVFERAKTVHVLVRAATVIGKPMHWPRGNNVIEHLRSSARKKLRILRSLKALKKKRGGLETRSTTVMFSTNTVFAQIAD